MVAHAKDGREAVALAESLKPDVITMDINMPHVDGLQATAQIMTTNPRPIVIVSSESREGAASTLKALELGAIEFVAKPSSGIDLDMRCPTPRPPQPDCDKGPNEPQLPRGIGCPKRVLVGRAKSYWRATTSISTSAASLGRTACTVLRAGGTPVKNFAYTSFMA